MCASVRLVLLLQMVKDLEIEWQNGLVKRVAGGNITGSQWGPETADRGSFFTLTDLPRGCHVKPISLSTIPGGFTKRVEAEMAEGHWFLDLTVRHEGSRIHVQQELICLAESVFQDFVVRFKFHRNSFETATIDGHFIKHKNRNIWHQYAARKAVLHGPHGIAQVSSLNSMTCGKFTSCIYVRDEPGSWIVHVRLIPSEPCDLYWIRWANRFFTLSLGDHWSRQILKWGWLKRKLWYLAERKGGRPALQAQGLSRLALGQRIGLEAECEINAI